MISFSKILKSCHNSCFAQSCHLVDPKISPKSNLSVKHCHSESSKRFSYQSLLLLFCLALTTVAASRSIQDLGGFFPSSTAFQTKLSSYIRLVVQPNICIHSSEGKYHFTDHYICTLLLHMYSRIVHDYVSHPT